jgi:GNAT superfamily N-acetyltransferase
MVANNPGMTELIRAGEADLEELSRVIADAFHDLPASLWLVADPEVRAQIFPGYFRLYVEHALAHGLVHTTADRAAAALWIPVGDEPPDLPPDYPERLAALTQPWTDRFLAFDEALERRHPIGVSHHYLAILAVRPDRQGSGLGTALLTGYHQSLDEGAAQPAYLEAADQRTRRFYGRHGYLDRGASIELPQGPRMYPMWRPATR